MVGVGVLGLLGVVAGAAVFVPRIVVGDAGVPDYLGALVALAGLGLVIWSFREGFRGRSWRAKLLGIPIAYVLLQWALVPAVSAGLATHANRSVVPAARTLGFDGAQDVTFPARDGVRLSGWYVPGRNGAAIVLGHGSHADRSDTIGQLRVLVGAGYGVLAYDARGHGQSGGTTNALGWKGVDDVAGAVAFLRHQPGVRPGRIGMLGLSMGAEEALRAAASGVGLNAVIADGAGASTTGDAELTTSGLIGAVDTSDSWLAMRLTELVSGDSEPPALKDVVARIHVPVLLIASNAKNERTLDQSFRNRIGPSATLWYVPDAAHTKALAVHPAAYSTRITEFLQHAFGMR